jgi:hypothetical protein
LVAADVRSVGVSSGARWRAFTLIVSIVVSLLSDPVGKRDRGRRQICRRAAS